jgi:hypothetical protein
MNRCTSLASICQPTYFALTFDGEIEHGHGTSPHTSTGILYSSNTGIRWLTNHGGKIVKRARDVYRSIIDMYEEREVRRKEERERIIRRVLQMKRDEGRSYVVWLLNDLFVERPRNAIDAAYGAVRDCVDWYVGAVMGLVRQSAVLLGLGDGGMEGRGNEEEERYVLKFTADGSRVVVMTERNFEVKYSCRVVDLPQDLVPWPFEQQKKQ